MVKSEWFSLSRRINKKLKQFMKKNIGDQTINNSTAQKLTVIQFL